MGSAQGEAEVETFILDYKNAFMSVPVAADERQYTCCDAGSPLRRSRAPLDPDEPEEGAFVVWFVLGFGAKSYPLLYARVALVSRRVPPR